MKDAAITNFLILGISVVAFILAIKFLVQFLPDSVPVAASVKHVVLSI